MFVRNKPPSNICDYDHDIYQLQNMFKNIFNRIYLQMFEIWLTTKYIFVNCIIKAQYSSTIGKPRHVNRRNSFIEIEIWNILLVERMNILILITIQHMLYLNDNYQWI